MGESFFFYTMSMKILSLVLIFCFNYTWAQTPEKSFAPHMIDHEFKGCPENSHCSREMGAKRLQWVELLTQLNIEKKLDTINEVQNFQKEHGLPIPMWGFAPSLVDKNIISWNSSCPHHNREIKEVFHAISMIKSFNELEEHNLNNPDIDQKIKVLPKKIWLEEKSGDIVEFRIPRGFLPTMIIRDQLYFTMEEKGIYYGLLVDRDGNMKVTPTQTSAVPSKEVPCSKALKNQFDKWAFSDRLYQDSYCKAIWDKENETYQVLMIGWSCP